MSHTLTAEMCALVRYYLGRQDPSTQGQREALQAGHYEPLLQARFHLIGQDLVLREMTRAVASHSRRRKEGASLSLVLAGLYRLSSLSRTLTYGSGPSGHGKSYFASKSMAPPGNQL